LTQFKRKNRVAQCVHVAVNDRVLHSARAIFAAMSAARCPESS
jgi:hypothetical protein